MKILGLRLFRQEVVRIYRLVMLNFTLWAARMGFLLLNSQFVKNETKTMHGGVI